jgi:hypothetical protein
LNDFANRLLAVHIPRAAEISSPIKTQHSIQQSF